MGEPKLTKFVVGQTTFLSHGISRLKVTQNEEVQYLEIPIKSIGVQELMDELRKDTPKPPVKLTTVRKGDELNTEFGLRPNEVVKVFDVTNEDYLETYSKFHNDFTWRIVIFALDLDFEDTEVNIITEFEEKKKALINMDFTGHHQTTIVEDVMRLTSDKENVADFLSGKP